MKVSEMFPSDYLKASDLQGQEVAVTIDRWGQELLGQGDAAEQKTIVYFQNKDRGLVLNKTNANALTDITGSDESDDWIGHQVVLFPDTVDFKGDRVPCIRVKASQAVPQPKPEPVTELSLDDIPF